MNKAEYAKLRSEVIRGIQALRGDGQDARADGATMFLDSSREYEDYDEDTGGFNNAVWILKAAHCWVQGGRRSGDKGSALGARSECAYEIRNPQGDLEFATDDDEEVNAWIEARDLNDMLKKFDEQAPDYVLFDRDDNSVKRLGLLDAELRIQKLRDAGQLGRADGAEKFLYGARESMGDGMAAAIREKWENMRLDAALCWIEGGERRGSHVIELGKSSGREYEIRDPRGDLVFVTDDGGAVGDWIIEFVESSGYERQEAQFGEDSPSYSVFTRHDRSFVSINYIYRVALSRY